ncbi:gluconeogenesis factor YvcK family protein [Corynebacterium pseudopelargi]|uniref:Putative gluconeogenesis factor n=1 Tax=Corynebacterium pseudopelargi TaxID=2080757 RepID=A0A3G6ITY2_9CORY|nr:uridine diphosphate-N-acetylglucosamine-binding protein YvcK [Corynebacterium pseudopelargi]AZA09209.1 Putative gluconeogenesis factor [Corynebacterium pseudopelargi]
MKTPHSPAFACLGGGHGLFQTLRAVRSLDHRSIDAIVTVADDGGSSGRIRKELRQVPPGDLRMALAALAPFDDTGQVWEETLQHRFGGHGALAGHAVGNLLLAGLVDVLGDEIKALDLLRATIRAEGRVLPVCARPLDIAAEVSGLDDDPRIMREVRGQVAVASTPGTVRRVRLIPEHPKAAPEALQAIEQADIVTLGPGSWFSSVIPHLLVDGITEALARTEAMRVVVLNLSAEPGETAGFSAERHLHILAQHDHRLRADVVIVDSQMIPNQSDRVHLERAAKSLGARIGFYDLREEDEDGLLLDRHDPAKLASALLSEYQQ